LARKRLTYIEIVAAGNPRHLSKANLEIRRLEDEAAALGAKNLRQRRAVQSQKPAIATVAQVAPVTVTDRPPVGDCAAEAKRYCENIVSGQILAGKLHIAACRRYLDDLIAGPSRGFRFDAIAAQRVADFVGKLDLGTIQPFQYFIISAIFGFIRDDSTRRTRTGFICFGKKNGKSSLSGALAIYMAAPAEVGGDGETRPMVDFCATTRYQSQSICFKEALRLCNESPEISAIVKLSKTSITFPDSLATIEPLAGNSDKLNGRNSHAVFADELADHPTPDLWNTLSSGQIGRRSPLSLAITTAGAQREGNIAFESQQHAEQILDGTIEDDAFFALICQLDEDDDWQNEKNWVKANPGLGTLIPIDNLRDAAKRAATVPSAKSLFLRYHVNRWAEVSEHAWLSTEVLQKPSVLYINESEKCCTIPERIAQAQQRLYNRPCALGLDLGRNNDLSALAIWFPPLERNGMHEVLFRIFCPEETIVERSRAHRVPYQRWAENGYIIPTPGSVIDEDRIFQEILALKAIFNIREIGFDTRYAQNLAKILDAKNLKCTRCEQGYDLGPAIAEIEKLLFSGKICLHGHPIAIWNLSNAVLQQGVKDCRLDKNKSREKIDAAMAMCDAMSICLVRPPVIEMPSFFFMPDR
jgi:phage terminase large subunit-like protein